MADTKISALTDGTTLAATDRIPIARSPFASGDNRYLLGSAFTTAFALPSGTIAQTILATAPTGWVLLDGRTIGNASSAATNRANADTATLFAALWDNLADAEALVPTGRGLSAAADYAANKTITLPDGRGRVLAGQDDMGGSAASRLTTGGSGVDGATLGTSGGTETHTLTIAQLASHTHTVPIFTTGASGSSGVSGVKQATNMVTGSAGSDTAHQNTQPTLVVNHMIKL